MGGIYEKKHTPKRLKRPFFSFPDSVQYRRSQYVLRTTEHVRAHHNVLVLPVGRPGPQRAEILVVEEVLDQSADGAILGHHAARVPTAIHRLQLPEGVRLVDRHARRYVLLPVQGVLQATIHETIETNGKRTSMTINPVLELGCGVRRRRRRMKLIFVFWVSVLFFFQLKH